MLKFFHLPVTQPAVSNPPNSIALYSYFIMAVVYVSRGKAIMFYRCTLLSTHARHVSFTVFLFSLFFVHFGRIPFILLHNIRTWCNLILHRQKLVNLHPHRKITQKPPKMGISETESDIRWRITLQ